MQYSGLPLSAIALLSVIAVFPSSVLSATLEERVQRIENKISSGALTDMFLQLEELRNEMQRLRGDIEVQTNAIEGIKKRQREIYLDIDRRLQALENRSGVPDTSVSDIPADTTVPSTSLTTPPADVKSPSTDVTDQQPPAGDPLVEQSLYRAALNMLKEGRYATAITQFRAFINKYPQSEYADNSLYWLGEASYVTQDYKQALQDFQRLTESFPNSPKYPDALLKTGYCQFELKDLTAAEQTLQQVLTRFPQSSAARLAKQRLQKLKLQKNG